MKIEDIDIETIDYNKNNFFYSDLYLRKLFLYNTPKENIQDAFSKCYQVYYDLRYTDYRKHRDSQLFLEQVTDKVQNTTLTILDTAYPPKKNQKLGLIHILANDKEKDVRWGNKECD